MTLCLRARNRVNILTQSACSAVPARCTSRQIHTAADVTRNTCHVSQANVHT